MSMMTPDEYEENIKELKKTLKEKAKTEVNQKSPEIPNKPKKNYTIHEAYAEARETVLKTFPDWRQHEFIRMERENNKDNRFYDEFNVALTEEWSRLLS